MKATADSPITSDSIYGSWTAAGFCTAQARRLADIEAALHGIETLSRILEADAIERGDPDQGHPMQPIEEEGVRNAIGALASMSHATMERVRHDITTRQRRG